MRSAGYAETELENRAESFKPDRTVLLMSLSKAIALDAESPFPVLLLQRVYSGGLDAWRLGSREL